MVSLNVRIDDETLERARLRALREGSSIAAVVGRCLDVYGQTAAPAAGATGDPGAHPVGDPGDDSQPTGQRAALDALLALSVRCASGSAGRRWTRDDLHDRTGLVADGAA